MLVYVYVTTVTLGSLCSLCPSHCIFHLTPTSPVHIFLLSLLSLRAPFPCSRLMHRRGLDPKFASNLEVEIHETLKSEIRQWRIRKHFTRWHKPMGRQLRPILVKVRVPMCDDV